MAEICSRACRPTPARADPTSSIGHRNHFGREGRAGTRIIRMRKTRSEATAATVSTDSADIAKKLLSEGFERTSRIPQGLHSVGCGTVLTVLTIWTGGGGLTEAQTCRRCRGIGGAAIY